MFEKLFPKNEILPPASMAERGLIHSPLDPNKMEQRDIERSYTRLFSSDDGQKILAHLQVMTFHRALGPGADDAQLRYMEGQRSLVATILRLIDRGRQG